MKEKQDNTIFYKIMADKKYRVFKTTFNDKNFYKIQVSQKTYDGQILKFYKTITFKKGVEVANETDIIIEEAYENLRENPKDPYNPISTLMITKFTQLESQEQAIQNAYDDFRDNLDENQVVIDENFLD